MNDARASELLAEARKRIETSLAELSQVAGPDTAQSPADQGSQLADREVDEGLAESLRGDLAAIERAEARLEEGTYGRSIESGEPIPDARLEALPWAERTASEEGRRAGG